MTRRRATHAGLFVLFAAFLLPVLHAPFRGDDFSVSELGGYLRLSGDSFFGLLTESGRSFVVDGARPQITGAFPGLPVYRIFGGSAFWYHVYLIALTVVAAVLFFRLLLRLGAPRPLAALAVGLAGGLMQIRLYHDSLWSYAGLLQYSLIIILASCLLLKRHLEEGRRGLLIGSVACFVLACLLYENNYSLAAVPMAIAFVDRRGRAAARLAAPYAGVAVGFVVTSFVMRKALGGVDATYEPGGGPWVALRTYALQLVAPLPDSSILFDPSLAGRPTKAEWLASAWRGLALAGLVVAAGLLLLRSRIAERRAGAALVPVGLMLFLAPPLLLSVAPKYQTEITAGRGYLPVLIQVFGITLLLAVGIHAVLGRAQARSRAAALVAVGVMAALTGLVGGVTAFSNVRSIASELPAGHSRDLMEAATRHGAFGAVPARARIHLWNRDVAWVSALFHDYDYFTLMLANETGRRYAATMQAFGGPEPTLAPIADAAWARVRLSRDAGTVVVADMGPVKATGYQKAAARTVRVYHQVSSGKVTPPELVAVTKKGKPVDLSYRKRASGSGWALYDVTFPTRRPPVASSFDDPAATVNFDALPPAADAVRLLGTKTLLP